MSGLVLRAGDAASWCGGALVRGESAHGFGSVSIDTRTVERGALFFAIRGPRHDAHAFLGDAIARGASGVVVERGRSDASVLARAACAIEVDDTTRALGLVARGHRHGFRGPLVGLTGSSGKTTTKEMCAAVLAAHAPTLATRGNLNNEFGVPLTLLRRTEEHALAVIEMGMNHRGEIARLAAIAQPTIGVLTNIGTAHIEFLGSQQAIADEKGDLFAALPASGVACVNLDDGRIVAQSARAACPSLTYGRDAKASITATKVRFDAGSFAFSLATPAGASEVCVRGLSETSVINALAATAAGLASGLAVDTIARGLAAYRPIRGRMTPVPLASGIVVVDDTYNANPDSMRASLEAVRALATQGRAFAVLGDMGELGASADAAHRELGARAARLGIDALFALGARAALVCEGATSAGLARADAAVVSSHDDAAERISSRARAGDWVLVKGSRSMQMERVVSALEAEPKERR